VARLFSKQGQDDQLQIARCEFPSAPEAATAVAIPEPAKLAKSAMSAMPAHVAAIAMMFVIPKTSYSVTHVFYFLVI